MVALEHLDYAPMLAAIREWKDLEGSVSAVREKGDSYMVKLWKKMF